MDKWKTLASDDTIAKTIKSLAKNNISAQVVEKGQQAKEKVLDLLPQNSEVMTMSSVTLETIGITREINESGKYKSVKKQLMSMDRKTQGRQMQKIGTAPDFAIGSVHAVTEDGHVLIASNSGSQLPAYAYGSEKVIWVVGAQKIVSSFEEGLKRIYEYILPLESDRLNKSLNITAGSFVSKLLVINRDFMPSRLHIIFVKEVLGF